MLVMLRHDLRLGFVMPCRCSHQRDLAVKQMQIGFVAVASPVRAGSVDAGAEVEQPGGGLPRQADGAPQGAARPARRRAPGP